MLDFNRGSYIVRVINGNKRDENKRIHVTNRGDIGLDDNRTLVLAKNIHALSVGEEYSYLVEKGNTESKTLPVLVALIISFLGTWFFVWLLHAQNNWVLWFFILILMVPTLGLLAFFITRNIMSFRKDTVVCYEVELEWEDQKYQLLLSEKELRNIQNR